MNSKARAILAALSGNEAKEIPDLPLLHFMARHFTFGDMVEVGVGAGYSTVALLSGITGEDRRLLSYDVDAECPVKVATLLKCRLGDPPLDPWIFRQLPSAAASDDYEPGSVGFLFLNTGHAYEDVKDDLAVWCPKMLPDGAICGTGYASGENSDQHGVNRAIQEFMKENDHWYQLMVPMYGRGLFVIWPKMFLGRKFGEPAGGPW